MEKCGAPTKNGTPCKWERPCKYHGTKPTATATSQPGSDSFRPEAVAERDLASLGWWTIGAVLSGELEAPRGSVVAALMRIIVSLDEQGDAELYGWERTALETRLANGLLPKTDDEWALAEQIVDEETFAELRARLERAMLPPDAPFP